MASKRNKWLTEEDNLLLEQVGKHGVGKWSEMSKEMSEIVKRHGNDNNALRKRYTQLKEKHIKEKGKEEETPKKLTREEILNLPEKQTKEWFKDEDDVIMDGYEEMGNKWTSIYKKYEKKLIRHKVDEIRRRLVKLQNEQKKCGKLDKRLRKPIDNEKEKLDERLNEETMDIDDRKDSVVENNRTALTCKCGKQHTIAELLMKGLKCDCARTLTEMLDQVKENYKWIVYIKLSDKNLDGLSDEVEYVGVSNEISTRVKKHENECMKDINFRNLRVSLMLGENQLINLLKPNTNIKTSGNNENSDKCRLLGRNGFKEIDLNDNNGNKYRGIVDMYGKLHNNVLDILQTNDTQKILNTIEYNKSAGILFTEVTRTFNVFDEFCMIKEGKCECEKECIYRRMWNGSMGWEISKGLKLPIRNNMRKYKQIVKVIKGENRKWALDYANDIIDRNKDSSKQTKLDYKNRVKRLWEREILQRIDEPLVVLQMIKNSGGSKNTHKTLIIVIMSLLSHMTNVEIIRNFGSGSLSLRVEYQRVQDILTTESQREVQMKTERDKRNWESVENIKKAIDEMERDCENLFQYQRVLWYKMQIYQNTLRNENRTLKVNNYDEEKDNYIDLKKGIVVYNVYKTSQSMGRQEFELVDEIKDMIRIVSERRKDGGYDYLFINQKGHEFTTQDFGRFMSRGFERYVSGRRIGSQMLRKIMVTENRIGEKSIAEKLEMSRGMLHSSGMSEKYRRIN